MKRILVILGLLVALFGVKNAEGQGTITVTGQVTDSDGQTWNNGTCAATYAGSGTLTNKVTSQTITPTTVSCTLDSGGSFSITLVSTTNVLPAIPGVTFRVCPQMTNAQCYTTAPILIGTTSPQSVSAQIDLVIQPPRVTGTPLAQAYSDTEVTGVLGNMYARLSDSTFRCYTTSWGGCGGGSGSGTVNAGTTGQIAYYPGNAAAVSGANYRVVNCAGINDTSAIQAALNVGGYVKVVGSCVENSHLTIKSNTTLDAYDATFTYAPATADWILINQAATASAQRTFSDAVATANSTTLTSGTAAFTLADVGQSIKCTATMANGYDLHTSISKVTNGTTITLTDPPLTSVNPATCSIYTRDTNIVILGGTYNMAGTLSQTTNHENIRIETANNVTLRDVNGFSPATTGIWQTLLEDVTGYSIWNYRGVTNTTFQDAINIQGPATDGIIYGTHCETADDCIGVDAQDQTPNVSTDQTMYGTVSGLLVDSIEGSSPFGTAGIDIYVWSHLADSGIKNVTVRRVHGSFQGNGFPTGVKLYNWSGLGATAGTISGININDVSGNITTYGVTSSNQTPVDVTVTNVDVPVGATPISFDSVTNPKGLAGIPDGTVTSPAMSFAAEPGTGFYRNGTAQIGVAGAGAGLATFSTSGIYTVGQLMFTNSFGSAPDASLSRTAAHTFALGNGTQGDATATLALATENISTAASGANITPLTAYCTGLTSGYCQITYGKGVSSNNEAEFRFNYLGSGNAGNNISMGVWGSEGVKVDASGNVTIAKLTKPGTIYSAAGTALPSCVAGLNGNTAIVSDATIPTYLGTYTSGGAVVAPVMCNGTNWVTY